VKAKAEEEFSCPLLSLLSLLSLVRLSAAPPRPHNVPLNLLAELRQIGFQVTLSSVSRDLRDMGVYRDNGRYVLPPAATVGPDVAAFFRNVRKVDAIGPYQTLITTNPNAAALIAQAIDDARCPEVGGTFPSANEKILVLTGDRKSQERFLRRLAALMART
jgi:arginine repressor